MNTHVLNLILTLVISSSQRYNIYLFTFHSGILILAEGNMLLCPRCHTAHYVQVLGQLIHAMQSNGPLHQVNLYMCSTQNHLHFCVAV
jgi:hypothetical protein